MDTRSLLSVGIDVGTTTTQVVFSRLTLTDTARAGQIPRIGITQREIVYQSPVTFTPLLDHDTVDAARLNELVRREYAAAGVAPGQVETGAVIITLSCPHLTTACVATIMVPSRNQSGGPHADHHCQKYPSRCI